MIYNELSNGLRFRWAFIDRRLEASTTSRRRFASENNKIIDK